MSTKVIKDNKNSILNDGQKKFCIEYLKDLNGLQAYRRAYGNKLSDETCSVNSCKLLRNTNIREYINELLDEYKDYCDVTIGEIVANVKRIAFDESARNSDRLKACEILARYKQMFVDKVELTSNSISVTLEDD